MNFQDPRFVEDSEEIEPWDLNNEKFDYFINEMLKDMKKSQFEDESKEIKKREAFLKIQKTFESCLTIEHYDIASNMLSQYHKEYDIDDILIEVKSQTAKRLLVAEFFD
jgi:hypothetical protein